MTEGAAPKTVCPARVAPSSRFVAAAGASAGFAADGTPEGGTVGRVAAGGGSSLCSGREVGTAAGSLAAPAGGATPDAGRPAALVSLAVARSSPAPGAGE